MNLDDVLSYQDPIHLAQLWIKWAEQNANMTYPNAMSLATVDESGCPSVRVVLLKEVRNEGFVFFTNYNSRKGRDISQNSIVGANFYWDQPFRQIKIQGRAVKLSRQESVDYWNTRPRESQISQFVSKQSEVAESKSRLEQEYLEASQLLAEKEIVCPEHWGGYIIIPTEIIFWIGNLHRFHDCFRFRRNQDRVWLGQRLYP